MTVAEWEKLVDSKMLELGTTLRGPALEALDVGARCCKCADPMPCRLHELIIPVSSSLRGPRGAKALERRRAIVELYDVHGNQQVVAEIFGITRQAVSRHLVLAGITKGKKR